MSADHAPTAVAGIDDPALLQRLALYARRRLAAMRGPRLDQPEDYVARAVLETLEGRRRRPPEIGLFQHLAGVISSLVSHDAARLENRSVTPLPDPAEGDGADLASDEPTPDAALIERQEQERQARLVVRVLQELASEPDLRRAAIIVMQADQTPRPRDLAAALGIAVDDVYNMRKRLQRRLGFLFEPAAGARR